jgi:4-amino-4-deoxy-L-arabinose transferase-like glycosyltransferase
MDAPDEPAHLQAIMQVRVLGMIPEVHYRFDTDPDGAVVKTPVDSATVRYLSECGVTDPFKLTPYESYQAPLYYLVVGLIASVLPRDPRVVLYLARLVSVTLGAGTVFFCWRAVRWLAPREPIWADATALVVALLPQFSFIAATASNDSALNCASAAAFAVWFRAMRRPDYDAWMLRGGALTGLAILAKLSGMALLPGLALVVIWRTSQIPTGRVRIKRFLQMVLGAASMVAVIAGWWFVRNAIIYGDPIGVHDSLRFFRAHFPPFRLDAAQQWRPFLALTWKSFLGVFGWLSRPLPKNLYWGSLIVACFLITLTLAAAAFRLIREPRLSPMEWQAVSVMTVVIVGLITFYLAHSLAVGFQPQGRYFFPAILPFALLLTGGLTTVRHRTSSKGCGVGTVLICLWLGSLNIVGLIQLSEVDPIV